MEIYVKNIFLFIHFLFFWFLVEIDEKSSFTGGL